MQGMALHSYSSMGWMQLGRAGYRVTYCTEFGTEATRNRCRFGLTRHKERDFGGGGLLESTVSVEMSSDPKPGTTTGALGAQLGTAVRVLRNPDTQQRLFRGVMAGGKSIFGSLSHVARQLWLQVTGFIFLCFAVIGTGAFVREYRAYTAGKIPAGKPVLAFCFAAIFLYFGLESFWRSRKKKQ